MKKIIILFVLFFTTIHCYSQNKDLKFYLDINLGFEGYATAIYMENLSNGNISGQENKQFEAFNKLIAEKLSPISKLTKNNNWLFHKAMNEWDYEKGEIYSVLCTDSLLSNNGVAIIVLVNGKDDFIWHAYSINEGDLKKFLNE